MLSAAPSVRPDLVPAWHRRSRPPLTHATPPIGGAVPSDGAMPWPNSSHLRPSMPKGSRRSQKACMEAPPQACSKRLQILTSKPSPRSNHPEAMEATDKPTSETRK